MRKILFLLLWVFGILFPFAGLGKFWPAYRRLFDTIFGPLWMHIFMHALLYAGLAILLLVMRKPQTALRRLALVLGAVVLVGLFQEGFQAISSGVFLPAGSFFDLGVDLAGGILGMIFQGRLDSRGRDHLHRYGKQG